MVCYCIAQTAEKPDEIRAGRSGRQAARRRETKKEKIPGEGGSRQEITL